MRNYSKQREVILDVLCSTTSHPTVQWIYKQAKKSIPNISLGTVYRNLSELKNEGRIIEVSVADGFQHFDGNPMPHLHFHCLKCNLIYDCELPDNSLKNHIEKKLDCKVYEQKLVFDGICEKCSVKNIT